MNCNRRLSNSPIYCEACSQNFVAIKGICLQPPKIDDIHCNLLLVGTDLCDQCNQDYFIDKDGFCHKNFNLNVSECQGLALFDVLDNRCLYKDIYCEAISYTTYECVRCQDGFTLANGSCSRNACIRWNDNNICVEAFSGYTLNPANNIPEKNPPNCIRYNTATKICQLCSNFTKNITLSSDDITPVCAYEDANCIRYNTFGNCIACTGSYVLKKRRCYIVAQNCRVRVPTDNSLCQ